MKLQTLLFSLVISGASLAQAVSAAPSITDLLATPVPAGANSAAVAVPRLEWVQRVKNNNDRAQKAASSIKLVFDGDSITDGWQGSGKAIWARRYAQLGAFDFGISADRTQHVLWRLSAGQVDNLKPVLIALMIGTNNLSSNTDEQIAEGIASIVRDYRARCPEAVVLLQAIFPRGQKAEDSARARIKAINHSIAKLHDGKKVVFVDFGEKFLNADGSMSPEIMPDFLHPSEQGYQIWADAIQPVIDQYFPPAAAVKSGASVK
ncbi:MAG: GDSL-type esterase/lipase family protein [Verrucomicrobia bacterium]|nr:GDSL-type esterase/lipase family protein [Verrucomicrobiota bacterium]